MPQPAFTLSHSQRLLLLGSCFADHIGARLKTDKFPALVNPFGTLYSPDVIAHHLRRCMEGTPYTEADVWEGEDGLWRHWMHQGLFAAPTAGALVDRLNRTLLYTADWLRHCDVLLLTWGTSVVYRLKEGGQLVANCHRRPDGLFVRSRTCAAEIVDIWRDTLQQLCRVRPDLRVVLTVSPVRHRRDGLHGNNLSKAELLIAADTLAGSMPGRIAYFPAYELLLDELRDYRFYAPDMVHPTAQAADYIYERLCEAFVPEAEARLCARCRAIAAALTHRPFRPEGEDYQQLLRQQLQAMEAIERECPLIDFTEERALCNTRLRK